MRKLIIVAATAALAFGLAACSEKTQDTAADAAKSAGNDVEAAGAAVGNAAEKGVNAAGDAVADAGRAVGNAADKAAAETDELGNKAENARAKVEANAHNESVEEAKRD